MAIKIIMPDRNLEHVIENKNYFFMFGMYIPFVSSLVNISLSYSTIIVNVLEGFTCTHTSEVLNLTGKNKSPEKQNTWNPMKKKKNHKHIKNS